MIRKLLGLMAVVAFAWCAAAFGQSDNASISGFVKDASSASVPNASVIIKNEATGVERRTKTNESGYYVISNIPPAYYTVRVEAAGFRTFEQTANKLDPNINTSVDVTLQVGAITETVEVAASVATLQSETATVGKLVDRQQIDLMELNGRNPIFLAQLMPGVRSGSLAGFSFAMTTGGFSINGSRTPENLITFDGAPAVRTRSNGTSIGAADVDSTQEIQVLTANYAPEYGRASGGQVRIVTRSGTTSFHGSAYEYFRNSELNANSWSRNANASTGFVPPFRYNQFGYNVGGPLYIPGKFNKDKNKVFWYWGQEWVRYRQTDTVFQTVPTTLMRNGNFSELLDPKNVFYTKTVIVNDPTTCPSVGAASCLPFQGNIVPQNRLSPNGIGLLRAYPEPNISGFVNGSNNWYGVGPHPTNQRKDTLSVDLNPGDRHRIAFRRLNYAYFEYQPLDGGSDRTPKYFNRPNQTNSLDWVWTISPRLVNEALATVSLDDVYIPLDLTKGLYDRTKYGINYPYLFPDGKEVQTRIPTLSIPNFYGLNGGPYPSHSSGPIYDVSDSLSWIKGNHTFKFGFLYEKSGENDFDQINVAGVPGGTNNQNGRFQFSDQRTGGGATSGVGIANAALGLFDVYSEIGKRSYTLYRGSMWESFAQDSWKVNPKLHLDYGVRWSVIVPYRALWNNMDVFDPSFYDPSKAVKQDPKTGYIIPGSGDPYDGIVIPGSGFPSYAKGRVPAADTGEFNRLFRGVPDHYSDIQWHQFQPRLGIAYNLSDKMVVRAGAGRFYTRLGVSDSVFLGGNPPFQPIASVSNGKVDDPGGGSKNLFPLTVTSQSKAFKNPEAWNWNFTLERQTFWKSVVSAAYVGRRGVHLQLERDINQLPAGTLTNPANAGLNPDYLRPYKGFAVIRETDNVASSTYNALQLNWTRRFADGFSFGIAYTLSKSMDDGSAQRDILTNAYDRSSWWAPSGFDTRHILVLNYIYTLPFFRSTNNLAGKVLGGWQISGVTQFQTGTPCNPITGDDMAGSGSLGNFDSCGGSGQLWVVNGDPKILHNFAPGGNADPNQWFATKNPDGSPIFTRPAPGTFAPKGARDSVYNPGFQNWNLGLFKRFAITERTGFQFRAEAYNFINHPNWSGANFNPTSQGFGKVTSKNSERNLQLSLRFYF